MNAESRVTVRWPVLVAGAIALVIAGGLASYVALRSRTPPPAKEPASTSSAPSASAGVSPATGASPIGSQPLPDVVVPISKEGIERAGIVVTTVAGGTASGDLRAPGVVEPNAYKQVVVTPLVSGRITRVTAELGQHVQRGQTIAEIFSPELAEAQTRYISARAMLDAHERELARTEKLAGIGAASQQELERIHAEHAARGADVESAASRLRLLGMSSDAIQGLAARRHENTTTAVPAPITGTVTERLANVGLNVDATTKLFTVVDLATVWVVADLYEKDFIRVHVGSAATITAQAYPGLALKGRVSYIDPQVSSETRTAKVRVEVPNPRTDLRLGMFVEVSLGAGEGSARLTPAIPRSAVQNVGDRTVVYLLNPKEPGTFIEREVRLGAPSGERVPVLAGVVQGDVIVAQGSFFVRAERERLGLRAAEHDAQSFRVTVNEASFDPQRLTVRAGLPARITFTRSTEKTCATAVVFPSLNIKRELPLNTPVTVEFIPGKTGEIAFACGMNMLHGTVVVQ